MSAQLTKGDMYYHPGNYPPDPKSQNYCPQKDGVHNYSNQLCIDLRACTISLVDCAST